MKAGRGFRKQQSKWLQVAHRIAGHLIYPCALIDSVSPADPRAEQEKKHERRKINEMGAELNGIVGELERQEQEEGGFGSAALLEGVESIRRPIRVTFAALVLGRLFLFLVADEERS